MDPGPSAIDDYIRANRGSYTDEAIRDNLVAAGHDPLAVEAAIRRIGSGTAWNPAPQPASPGGLMTCVAAFGMRSG